SATRSGSARDLLEGHGGALGLAWATPARSEAQSTFVRGLAEAVVAPDLAAPALSRASLERRERGQRAGIAAVAVALVLVSGTLVWAHRWNGRLLDRAQAAASAPAPGSLDELWRVRDRLDGAPAAARLLGWRHAEVRETVASLHARTLLEGAVGEVHRDHARDLHAFASGASQDYARAYEALRAYLRLSRETSLDAMPEDERAYERRWLAGHLAHAWQRSGALAPPSARLPWYGAHALALVEWLDAGSQALPLDAAVVSRARQRARSVDRTGASMDWLCELDGRSRSVDDLLGGRRAHLRGTASVPRAFTHEGLRDEVYPWLTTTALSLDEPWVLEGTPWSAQSSHQVRERLWSAYFRRYEDEWDKLLSAVEVEVPSDREASDRMLGGVAREIALLIDGVRRETMGLDASPESWANALLAWSLTRIGDPLDGPSLPPDPVRDAAARQLQENFAPLFAFGPGETVATYESYLTGASERAELEGRRTQVVQFVQRLDVGRWRLPLERLLVSPIDAALRRF
ncbi:MAG: hypothetical protein IT378_05650, partial [Sandaracinaceae bacterium]|nr:hypothetical protein [Sandaracinaceae bacterium]